MPCGGYVPLDDSVLYARENYDPDQPVCSDQDTFNTAFHKALRYNNKKSMKKAKPWMIVYAVIWLIFFVWAVLLAMKVKAGHDRVMHLVFAMIASPAYVLAYYIEELVK